MKSLLKKVIAPLKLAAKPFQAKYEVVCTNYHLIPGLPVNKNLSTHSFDRGAGVEARAFYTKVISSDFTRNMAPVEVQLRKIYIGTRTIEKAEFGPIKELQRYKMVTNN